MIKVTNLTKKYGDIIAVNQLSFRVEEGEFYGFLGPNGSGKTTTLNILSTIPKPDTGQVFINKTDALKYPEKAKPLFGYVPQEIALYPELSALRNLQFWGSLYNIQPARLNQKIEYLLDLFGLTDKRNRLIKTFSGGMKRRINFAASLLHNPKILFLDEPTVGVDPQSRNLIYSVIRELNKKGITIILASHYMDEVERLCNRIAILDEGKIISEGSFQQLKQTAGISESIALKIQDLSQASLLKNLYNGQLKIGKNSIFIKSPDISSELPGLINFCHKQNIEIEQLEILRPNLESIFLELTGKHLRD